MTTHTLSAASNTSSGASNTPNAVSMTTHTSSTATYTLSAANTAVNTSSAAGVALTTSRAPHNSLLQSFTEHPGRSLKKRKATRARRARMYLSVFSGFTAQSSHNLSTVAQQDALGSTSSTRDTASPQESACGCSPQSSSSGVVTSNIQSTTTPATANTNTSAQGSNSTQQSVLGSTDSIQGTSTPQASSYGCSRQSMFAFLESTPKQQSVLGSTDSTQGTSTPQASSYGSSQQSIFAFLESTPKQQSVLGSTDSTQGTSTPQASSYGSSRQSIFAFLESTPKQLQSSIASPEMVAPNTERKNPNQKATKAVVTSGIDPPQSCPEMIPSVNNVHESSMEECTASSSPSSQLTPKPSRGRKRRAKNTLNNNIIVRRSPRIAKKAKTEV